MAGLSDTILKGTHPGTIPARFGLIWFRCFRGEDLNVIFYQNMLNLHNRYKSAERKISQKSPEYMLNYSFKIMFLLFLMISVLIICPLGIYLIKKWLKWILNLLKLVIDHLFFVYNYFLVVFKLVSPCFSIQLNMFIFERESGV